MIRTRKILGVLAAGVLTMTACGSDDDDDAGSATTEAPQATEASPATEAPVTEAPATDPPETEAPPESEAPSETESTETEAPAGEPVVVGFANLEGGAAFSLPDVRRGFQAALAYVNDEGGVNGHPLEAITCNTELTPESSVNCTNEFIDKGVVAHVGGIDFAIDASLPILQEAGIAHFSAYAYGPATNAAVGDAFIATYPNEEGMPASLLMHQSLGAKSVAFILADVPAMQATMNDVVTPAAEALGLTATPYLYPPTGADWATLAATVLTSNPDAITMFGVEPECLAGVQALRDAGFEGPIHAGVCTQILSDLDVDTLKDVLVGAQYYTPFLNDLPADVQEEVDTFLEYMDNDGGGEYEVAYAQQGWVTGMFVASVLGQVDGEYTAASVREAAATATGHNWFRGDNDYDCGNRVWEGTTSCGSGTYFGTAVGDGKLDLMPDQPVDMTPVLGVL